MITVGRGRWVAIGLLAAHELMLHSGYGNTMLYQQGGLFGQDYVQDFMNSAARPLVQIASRLDAPQAMTQLALLTVRHDRRVVDFLAEQLHPSTFKRIATRPGGLHVIKNMTQSATADRERVRHVLQSAGVLDVLAQTVISATRPAVQAMTRSDKRAGFQYFSSVNTSLDILADLMLHTGRRVLSLITCLNDDWRFRATARSGHGFRSMLSERRADSAIASWRAAAGRVASPCHAGEFPDAKLPHPCETIGKRSGAIAPGQRTRRSTSVFQTSSGDN